MAEALVRRPTRTVVGLKWGAIFTGTFVGLALQFVLILLGLAAGLTALAGSRGQSGGPGVGAIIWALAVPIVAWGIGSFVASYASGSFRRSIGVVHGLSVWGLGLVVFLLLLGGSMGGMLSGAMQTFGGVGGVSYVVPTQDVPPPDQPGLPPELAPGPDPRLMVERAAAVAWVAFASSMLALGASMLGGAAGARAIEGRNFRERRREVVRQEQLPRGPIITPPTTV